MEESRIESEPPKSPIIYMRRKIKNIIETNYSIFLEVVKILKVG
jgi:hypothetical protein